MCGAALAVKSDWSDKRGCLLRPGTVTNLFIKKKNNITILNLNKYSRLFNQSNLTIKIVSHINFYFFIL